VQKKDILNAFFELFECSPEQNLQPLFVMMISKLFLVEGSASSHSASALDAGSENGAV
jgi:hypothetical protein